VCSNIVQNTLDSGPGSLRAAIAHASDGDAITFCPSVTGTILLTSGELLITNGVTILGPGASVLAVSGNYPNRVFHVQHASNVVIANLTIANGKAAGSVPIGGGIWNDRSDLTVSNCTISGNNAVNGGGIFNDGEPPGGGATLIVLNDTFVGNSATLAGGIFNDGSGGGSARLVVANSTLSDNSAKSGGGGIFNGTQFGGSALLVIINSTVSHRSGSGILNYTFNGGSSTVEIGSTIFDGGALGTSIINYFGGVVTSLGYNLSRDYGNGFLSATGDRFLIDPMLGPLQFNGGQTPTHALSCGSPAVNAGTNFLGLAADQRGDSFARTFGAATDVGAFEFQQICNRPPVAQCSNVTVPAGANCAASASIDIGSYDPDVGDSITNRVQTPPGPYGLGSTLVTLTVTDTYGAANSCNALVTVVDTTPPTVNCPDNIVATNDPGKCSAMVNYTVTATDNCGGVANITEDFPSGATYPKGISIVHVTAVDNAGNTNGCSFTVTVLDREPPEVACSPAPNPSGKISVPSNNRDAGVNPDGYYQLFAKDNCDSNPRIYVNDTGSTFVAGPFANGDIVRVKRAGGAPFSTLGIAPVVALISLKGNGLSVALDSDGNMTPDSAGCIVHVTIK